MGPLQRHQLVWLEARAWQRLLAASDAAPAWDPQALDCLQHWARQDLPLVVTRQPPAGPAGSADAALVLGLAAPARWGRRRLFVEARAADVQRRGHFPRAAAITALLEPSTRTAWQALCTALAGLGATARVYGSHGWQQLSGLPCLRDASDIDLLVGVASPQQADAVAARLGQAPFGTPRLDGELVFADGAAVAWREWADWRAGRTRQLLVKRLHGATLEDGGTWTACVAA